MKGNKQKKPPSNPLACVLKENETRKRNVFNIFHPFTPSFAKVSCSTPLYLDLKQNKTTTKKNKQKKQVRGEIIYKASKKKLEINDQKCLRENMEL